MCDVNLLPEYVPNVDRDIALLLIECLHRNKSKIADKTWVFVRTLELTIKEIATVELNLS